MRVIKVRGTGKASESPDLIVMNMEIISQYYDYNEALNDLNQRTAILKNDLSSIGFDKQDIKTTDFNVETVYKYVNKTRVFEGYKARHKLTLKFDFDKKLLNQTINTLSNSKAKVSFDIVFTLKDQEGFKQRVLADAVNNARQSALVIADTLGIKLGDITEVDYDTLSGIPTSRTQMDAVMLSYSEVDIDPEMVEQTDTVSVWWEIHNLY